MAAALGGACSSPKCDWGLDGERAERWKGELPPSRSKWQSPPTAPLTAHCMSLFLSPTCSRPSSLDCGREIYLREQSFSLLLSLRQQTEWSLMRSMLPDVEKRRKEALFQSLAFARFQEAGSRFSLFSMFAADLILSSPSLSSPRFRENALLLLLPPPAMPADSQM